MYKDKEAAKVAARERKRRQRAKGVTEGVTKEEGVTLKSVTENPKSVTSDKGVTQSARPNVAPVIHMLADPIKREKLRAISDSLKAHKLGEHVWLGIGNGVNFETVDRLLEAFPLKVVML